ncbi:MAG: hypothetical protein OHK0039_16900 [Bacteroidia bacterium]
MLMLLACAAQPPSWQRLYAHGNRSEAHAIVRTPTGDLIAAGYVVPEGDSLPDLWLFAVDAQGLNSWTQVYGRPEVAEVGHDLLPDDKGNLVVAGSRDDRGWLACFSPKQKVLWEQTFDGVQQIGAMARTANGFVLAGTADQQAWVALTDTQGRLRWDKRYPAGRGPSVFHDVIYTASGGIVLAGEAGGQFLLLCMDTEGADQWESLSGGMGRDSYHRLIETSDRHILAAGATDDFNSSKTNHFLTKVAPDGKPAWERVWGLDKVDEAPFALCETRMGYVMAGYQDQGGVLIACDPYGKLLAREVYYPLGDGARYRPLAMVPDFEEALVVAGWAVPGGYTTPRALVERRTLVPRPTDQPVQPVPPTEVPADPDTDSQVTLRYLAEGGELTFAAAGLLYEAGVYTTLRTQWPVGQLFQLQVDRLSTPYLYVFSIDGQGRMHTHFPRVGDPAVPARPFIIPDTASALSLEVLGTDYLYVIFAQAPVRHLDKLGQLLADGDPEPGHSLRQFFGERLADEAEVQYHAQQAGFSGVLPHDGVVPLVIAVEVGR